MNTETKRSLEQYIDHNVIDQNDKRIGTLQCLWSDERSEPAFLGVQTGWLFGKTHVVPADAAEVNPVQHVIRLPYSEEKVKDAPSYDPGTELDGNTQLEVRSYYGVGARSTAQEQSRQTTGGKAASQQRTAQQGTTRQGATQEGATVQLREEQIKVGKREVEAGGIRLRKVVRTETVNQPVELKREEIVVERVPGTQAGSKSQPGAQEFEEKDIYIPLRREEAVVQKESRVREEVRVSKKAEGERQNISEQVRKEDVEIQRSGSMPSGSKARGATPAGRRSGAQTERGERGHRAVFAILKDEQQASRVVDQFKSAGFSRDDISVLFPDKRGTKDFAHEKNTKAPEGATTGAGAGGIAGGVLGWLAGIGALAIPGVGPFVAAGPVMAALSGAAIGAGAGGLIGALVGLGIPEYEAKRYEAKLKEGNILISVHSDNSDETSRAKDIFERAGAEDISTTSEEKVHTE
jgi:uncharacterized protein (TIGR02271 family)